MDQKLKTLALLLDRMAVLYERMIALLGRERTALIALDFETLMTEMREKDEILAALRGLDKDRLRIQDQFAIVMGRDPEQVTLRNLAESLLEQGGSARELGIMLLEKRERIAAVMAELQDKVEANSRFIEKSVENLQGIAGHLSAIVTGKPVKGGRASGTYNGKAKYQSQDGSQTGTIMEKRL